MLPMTLFSSLLPPGEAWPTGPTGFGGTASGIPLVAAAFAVASTVAGVVAGAGLADALACVFWAPPFETTELFLHAALDKAASSVTVRMETINDFECVF